MDAYGGRVASGIGAPGTLAPRAGADTASGHPSPRLAGIRDALLRTIAEQGAVRLAQPPARWPLTREHAAALIEQLAREGLVEITRNGDGAVARVVGDGVVRQEVGEAATGARDGR